MTSNHLAFSSLGTSNLDDIDAKIVARFRDICRQHFPALSGASSDQFKLSLLRSRLVLFPPFPFFSSLLLSSPFSAHPSASSFCSGGFSNYMYLCSLPRMRPESDAKGVSAATGAAPERVILRFFGEILLSSVHSLVLNSVIFAILSERGIGPRLYGVFPGGRIEQYLEVRLSTLLITDVFCTILFHTLQAPLNLYRFPSVHICSCTQSRPLRCAELPKPEISAAVAHCFTLIHSLDMPLSKQPNFAFDAMKRCA